MTREAGPGCTQNQVQGLPHLGLEWQLSRGCPLPPEQRVGQQSTQLIISEGSAFPACEQAFINCSGNGENSTCVYACDEFSPANFTHYQITLSELIFGMTEPTAVPHM